jgi:hypothetical protein
VHSKAQRVLAKASAHKGFDLHVYFGESGCDKVPLEWVDNAIGPAASRQSADHDRKNQTVSRQWRYYAYLQSAAHLN